jgi:hypothetical protein
MKILLQTTIPTTEDDWSITRFGQLAACLRNLRDNSDRGPVDVIMRDRDALGKPDSILSTLDRQPFDELWLFAVDEGSVCGLGAVGQAHYFHTKNLHPDERMHRIDDTYTKHILWPNFHSGSNGDFQEIQAVGNVHPVLIHPASPTGALRYLPAHPHEGSVGAPPDEDARVIATGTSKTSGRQFGIAVAFEPVAGRGAALAASTFHHFADYNWDPRVGAPTFVDEPSGSSMLEHPEAIDHTRQYVENIARWLAPRRI